MTRTRALCLFALVVFIGCLHSGPGFGQTPEQAAQAVADVWLKVVDAARYDESWDAAAGLFKKAVTKEQWKQQVAAVRVPLGQLRSRKLKSAKFTRTLPGAPDGHYVVIQYDTSFASKANAVETVTPLLDSDGKWHVSGYFIK